MGRVPPPPPTAPLRLGPAADLAGWAPVAFCRGAQVRWPDRVTLIRGNHETREVNGNIEHYGEGSFLWQSVALFGDTDGHLVCD